MRALIDHRVDKILSLVNLGVDMWEQAGKLLVELKEENPHCFLEICEEHKDVTMEMLQTLEDIGERRLHPRTLLLPQRIASAVAEMPYDAQEYVAVNGSVRIRDRQGHHKDKSVRGLSVAQAGRAFSPNGIVEPDEQALEPAPKAEIGTFEIVAENGVVSIKKAPDGWAGDERRPAIVCLNNGRRLVRLVEFTG